ncbi:MAG: histidine--tRNA ligase [Candidatus Thalassarchaeaceae archaeon]|nr:histidine--tRNA ligase [Candidatus Thalassarchaeaceae archaeon]
MVERPRGTRDFYPEDMGLRNWLFEKFRAASIAHGFEEYDAPILEYEELYTRKQGEEITQQLFNFEDKGGRKMSLRPEMTPSLARMVMAQAKTLPLPIKWYSIPQCWRYERTQRGRGREHYQWNVDIWGSESTAADAELISIMVHFFKSVGLSSKNLEIRVSSRKVLEEVLGSLGIEGEGFTKTCIIIDKMDKLPSEVVVNQLSEIGLDIEAISTIQHVLGIRSLDELVQTMGEESDAVAELSVLFQMMESYGLTDWVGFDASIVRGLAYYTGPVFEAHDRNGELRAICGGGRYDRLLSSLGGNDMPATGFGFGDMVIMELLNECGLLPDIASTCEDVVVALSEELRPAAMSVASKLRNKGRTVDLILDNKKLKWAFRHTERIGASRLVMIMPEEWKAGKIRIKDLKTGNEEDVSFIDL